MSGWNSDSINRRTWRHRLSRLEHDFALALGLVLLTLAPLGFRSALIVMISIPLCLALGLAALQWSGFSLNQLSIVGCVIALGLVVDDAIVVVEDIARIPARGTFSDGSGAACDQADLRGRARHHGDVALRFYSSVDAAGRGWTVYP